MNRAPWRTSPVAIPFVVAFVLVLAFVIALLEVGVLTYAYSRLGVDRHWAEVLLFASIVGSWVNIPVHRFPERIEVVPRVVRHFGMAYVVPTVVREGETVVAVNVGGALVPAGLAGFLVVHGGTAVAWRSAVAFLAVTAVVHRIARPVPGLGIVVPTLVAPVVAVAAALALGGASTAAVAYAGGTIGTLVGADLLNLPRIRGIGTPMASIGGAGTFDGIFVTGILAVLLAAR